MWWPLEIFRLLQSSFYNKPREASVTKELFVWDTDGQKSKQTFQSFFNIGLLKLLVYSVYCS